MRFQSPQWLFIGGALIVLLLVGFAWSARRRERRLAAFGKLAGALVEGASSLRRNLKAALVVLAVAAMSAALARPQLGFTWRKTERKGLDLVLAIDTSKSMLANDLKPNRLARAKLAVESLVEKFRGDRVGLIAFAGTAFWQCPLTLDSDAFEQSLRALDVDVIPRGGTDLGSAIDEALAGLGDDADRTKVLVLLTDGEDHEGRGIEAARRAAEAGVKVYTVGLGSAEGGLVRLADGQVLKDRAGRPVTSRLDEAALRSVASATNASYVPLGADGAGLERLYEGALAALPRASILERKERVYTERYAWFAGLALFGLLAEFLFRERRRPRRRRTAVGAAAALALLLGAAHSAWADTAADAHVDPRVVYNRGVEAYRAQKYEAAQQDFDAAVHAEDLGLQAKAYYNLGNARFRRADPTKPGAARTEYQAAIDAYEATLSLTPDDADAKHNLEVARARLEALKQQQKKNDQSKGGDSSKDQQQSQGGDGSKDDQQQGKGSKEQQQGQGEGSKGAQASKDQQQGQGAQASKAPEQKQGSVAGEPAKDQRPEPQPGAAQGAPKTGEAPQQLAQAGRAGAGEEGMTPDDASRLLRALERSERGFGRWNSNAGQPSRVAEPEKDW